MQYDIFLVSKRHVKGYLTAKHLHRFFIRCINIDIRFFWSESVHHQDSPLFVSSLAKGLSILAAFGGSHRSMSLPEIAAATGMGKSSVQRAAYTLEALGYLCKEGTSKRFILTPKVLDLGFRYLQANPLVERASPYLHDGNRQCDETVNLAELDGTDVVLVARFLGRNLATARMLVGTRVPAFCTAAGRAMMSAMPEAQVEDIIGRSHLRAFTPHTLTDRGRILERVAEARRDGFSCVEQEYFRGDISVGAPVIDAAGSAVAAVTVYAPMTNWTAATAREKLAPVAMETARAISSAEHQRDGAGT